MKYKLSRSRWVSRKTRGRRITAGAGVTNGWIVFYTELACFKRDVRGERNTFNRTSGFLQLNCKEKVLPPWSAPSTLHIDFSCRPVQNKGQLIMYLDGGWYQYQLLRVELWEDPVTINQTKQKLSEVTSLTSWESRVAITKILFTSSVSSSQMFFPLIGFLSWELRPPRVLDCQDSSFLNSGRGFYTPRLRMKMFFLFRT